MHAGQWNGVRSAGSKNTGMSKLFLVACYVVFCMWQTPTASAEEASFISNRNCWGCHKEKKLQFETSAHGRAFAEDPTRGCQSCHGGGSLHIEVVGQIDYKGPLKIESFKRPSVTPGDKSRKCLACHQKDANRSHWMGSTHQINEVDCTSCHQIHTAQDRVRDKITQPEVCFTCHKDKRMEINKPSHHPIPEGKMACSDCHNPHGTAGPALLKRDSVNETCYTCHMEKRGPFVHNHAPVDENCTICHNPHGTTAESMLKLRPPFLCQQCHSPHGPFPPQLTGQGPLGFGQNTATTGGKSGLNFTMARGCVNCHTEIHGTNNPQSSPESLFFHY